MVVALRDITELMELDPLERLSRDLKASARLLTPSQARYLVDFYYQMQEYRIRAAAQDRAFNESGEPHELVTWVLGAMQTLENDIRRALDSYSESDPVGVWAKSIHGIGPVIAAGLLAHIDIEKAPTVGHIWRFAGLDPTTKWEKKTKRPWNAQLKVLCWKAGESFIKVSNSPKDTYGHVYAERKVWEQDRNERGEYAEQAAGVLEAKKISKDTEAYKWYSQGKLPPAHIHARARRYAVKLFIAHYHHVAYECRYGVPPPKPYVLEHLGHAHYIAPPNWPM
jgi:hypothetical protein